MWLAIAAAILVVLVLMNRAHVYALTPYMLVGCLLWFAVFMSGVHSTIAGVLLAFTIPDVYKRQPQESEAMAVIEAVAAERGCELFVPDFADLSVEPLAGAALRRFSWKGRGFETRLLGSYQPFNAALALTAVDVLRGRGWAISDEAAFAGIASARWPGRFEVVDTAPLTIVDGGHNPQEMCIRDRNSGAEYLGVATVDEAIALREAYVNAPILILGEPPATAIPLLLAYKIMPAVYTAEFAIRYAEAADAFGVSAPFHMKVNTGMNRIGVRWDEVVEFARQISFHRALDLVGTFTHFATADCPGTIDFERQVKRFSEAVNALRAAGINPVSYTHLCRPSRTRPWTAARRAKPSMAECAKGDTSMSLVWSAATTRPTASSSSTVSTGNFSTAPHTSARASSNGIISLTGSRCV